VSDYQPRHAADDETEPSTTGVTRHEEELHVGTTTEKVGSVRLRKTVESEEVATSFRARSRRRSRFGSLRWENDSGQIVTFPDGSVSVPIFEEEVVVTKRLVVKERIVIQKQRVIEDARIEANLLRERVEVEGDPGVLDEP
jgi:stress response protein YsnF